MVKDRIHIIEPSRWDRNWYLVQECDCGNQVRILYKRGDLKKYFPQLMTRCPKCNGVLFWHLDR